MRESIMKVTTKAVTVAITMALVIVVVAASVNAHYEDEEAEVQDAGTGLEVAKMELAVGEEIIAKMTEELENNDTLAKMQPRGAKKYNRGVSRAKKTKSNLDKYAKYVKQLVPLAEALGDPNLNNNEKEILLKRTGKIEHEMKKYEPKYKKQGKKKIIQRTGKMSHRGRPPFFMHDVFPLIDSKYFVSCGTGTFELTQGKLKAMVSTISQPNYKASYAYVDTRQPECRGRVFKSGFCENVKCKKGRTDSEMQVIDNCEAVRVYWSVWSPCASCVKKLVKFARDRGLENSETGYTIYIGKKYLDKRTNVHRCGGRQPLTEQEQENILQTHYTRCLEWLAVSGFRLLPWNWDTFKQEAGFTASDVECNNIAENAKDPTKDNIDSVTTHINNAMAVAGRIRNLGRGAERRERTRLETECTRANNEEEG